MMIRNRMFGNLQYQTFDEAYAADTWLKTYLDLNAAIRRPGGWQLVRALIPAHAEGCKVELLFEYHFETATQEDYDAKQNEVKVALYDGPINGGVATADCDSQFGGNNE